MTDNAYIGRLLLFVTAILLYAIIAANTATASFEGDPDHILVNSADWRDV
ncbi:MAG: hypothetical protein ACMXYL_02700 [Candidatus Woesearchaeota archaeon]